MQKRYCLYISLLFLCFFIMAETPQSKIIGTTSGYGVTVKFKGQTYIATPSHVLFGTDEPTIEYNGNNYKISAYHLSILRDFALLELKEFNLSPALSPIEIYETTLTPCEENFYFDCEITNSCLKNATTYQGFSGTLINFNNQLGLFQGYTINHQTKEKIFKAVTLTIFQNELHKVDFEKIRAEFSQKNLKK